GRGRGDLHAIAGRFLGSAAGSGKGRLSRHLSQRGLCCEEESGSAVNTLSLFRRRTRMNAEQQSKSWEQIVAKAWADEGFKRRLSADPAAVLKEHGDAVPVGVQVKGVENTEKVLYLTIPARPSGELTEEQLAAVGAGTFVNQNSFTLTFVNQNAFT